MSQKTAIIDYGSGNLKSARKAFQRAAHESGISADIVVTSDPDIVCKADRIVLPGVGAFADCKAGLEAIPGMGKALEDRVMGGGVPFFGICVGMQLMAERGLEKGVHRGFGWIKGEVKTISPTDPALKIPHMGWNTLKFSQPHPLLDTIADGEDGLHAYFVHTYHFETANQQDLLATTDYGGPVTAMVGRDNMVGTQFHPEKSQKLGLTLIGNFLRWKP